MKHARTAGLAVSGATLAILFSVAQGCSSSESSPGGTGSDASASSDTGKTSEGGSTKDGPAAVDDGSTASDCKPGDVLSFTPVWKSPAPFDQKKCTDAQVEALVNCLFEGLPDQTTCDAVMADDANKACDACLFTEDTSAAWGPVITSNGTGTLNTGGCIANVQGDTSKNGCGAKYAANIDCGYAACDSNCSGNDVTDEQYNQCLDDAAAGNCKSYATAAACADALTADGGAADKCRGDGGFTASAIALGKLFCGGAVAIDGGTDAASDAPVDAPADGG